jgi:hypothetical protein
MEKERAIILSYTIANKKKKKSIKQPFSRQAQKPRDDIYKLKKEEAINKNKNEKDSLNYFFSPQNSKEEKG